MATRKKSNKATPYAHSGFMNHRHSNNTFPEQKTAFSDLKEMQPITHAIKL
jgi:hypothetical protein